MKKKIIQCSEILSIYKELTKNLSKDVHIEDINSNTSFYEILNKSNIKREEKTQLLFILNKIAGYKIFLINDELKLLNIKPKVVQFKISQLDDIISKKLTYYSEFSIRKKSGGLRKINAPSSWLKSILNDVTTLLYLLRIPDKHSFGFELQKNIVDNAKLHIGKKVVLNIDLKDFFPSITEVQVKDVFMKEPFSLNDNLATLLTKLTTYQGKLPQGASTSPIISNYVCKNLDNELSDFCKIHNLTFSRYADDLTFSHTYNISEKLQNLLYNIIKSNGFTINTKKIRKQLPFQRQSVTGITVNERLNVRRKYINEIRAILDNWKKQGYAHAHERFLEINNIGNEKSISLMEVLSGKINFIGVVRGKEDWIYLKLKKQLDELMLGL